MSGTLAEASLRDASPSLSPITNNDSQDDFAQQAKDRRISRESTVFATQRSDAQAPLRTSSLAYQAFINSQRRRRKIRPQYTADADTPHVEFILVASFNIDLGSVMEHQYPGSISGDEHMLADLMLPDQMHNRSQDWTVFFLHKESSSEDDIGGQPDIRRRKRYKGVGDNSPVDHPNGNHTWDNNNNGSMGNGDQYSSTDEDEDDDEVEEAPLIYVLNLVNTKHDSQVERYVRFCRLMESAVLIRGLIEAPLSRLWQFVRDTLSYTYTR